MGLKGDYFLKFIGISIIQTIVFMLIIFFLERIFGVLWIQVVSYNIEVLSIAETGLVYFILIFISDLSVEGLRYGLFNKELEVKDNIKNSTRNSIFKKNK